MTSVVSDPVIMPPLYWPSMPRSPGIGPRGLGPEVRPLPLRISSRDPSFVNWTPVGYQPVGMKPSTWLAPGFFTSITATVLLSALATTSVEPSGERASAFGVEPAGEFG